MAEPVVSLSPTLCAQCGGSLAPMVLVCPSCSSLVHASELKRLAAEAENATVAGDRTAALTAWRQAIELLPASSRQYATVQERIAALSHELNTGAPATQPQATRKIPKPLAGLGAVGAIIWKFWTVFLVVLTKGKLLLLGLTKMSTLLSMAATFGIYWQLWGWQWALGLVLTTYVHEMGHVFALRRYGLPATAPMFIPGVGALVRLKQAPTSVREDAAIGLAGPIWGCASAVVCYALYLGTGWGSFAAAGRTAAWINLFNLLPVWQLDGSRGFRALSRQYRFIAAGTALLAGLYVQDYMLLAVGAVGLFRALGHDAPQEGDRGTLFTYVGLVIALTFMAAEHMSGLPPM